MIMPRQPGDPPTLGQDADGFNVIGRSWRLARRRATHNRLFDTLADLKRSIRNGLCYFQTVKQRLKHLIAGCYTRLANQTASAGL